MLLAIQLSHFSLHTVLNNSGSTVGDDISHTLRTVTTTRAEGIVRFGTSGAVNLSISIIAIGIAP